MHRWIKRLVDAQAAWAQPLGQAVQRWLEGIFGPRRELKDILNGTWFGHPIHPVVTDVPIGAMTVAALLDLAGEDHAADLALATGAAGMAASAVSGAADAVDAYGEPVTVATVHASLMVSSLTAYLASIALRLGPRRGRPLARLFAWAGYGTMLAGAYLGGDLAFRLGNQVDRHAFDSTTSKWRPLDVSEVPEGEIVKAKCGTETIILVREGDAIRALHATCAHAGGRLEKGRLVDGCVECPLHLSWFRVADGHVVHGPSVWDQPVYEVRRSDQGVLEARLQVAGTD